VVELPLIQPPQDLIDILLPAFGPCPEIQGNCRDSVRWSPQHGHVPRGFRGATGRLDEIRLVLVCAEPGDPYEDERHDGATALDKLRSAYTLSCWHLEKARDTFGLKIQEILNIAFPTLNLAEQMRRTWITESVLCSAASECAPVSPKVERACRSHFLLAQLDCLRRVRPDVRVVALGKKAQNRLRGVPGVRCASAAAPPEGNKPRARESWVRALEGLEP
jgi:hypothetical protein